MIATGNHTDFDSLRGAQPKGEGFRQRNDKLTLMNDTNFWLQKALELGFSHAYAFDPAILTARADVREMCAADRCRSYGKNWTCPPHCGSLEQCQARMEGCSLGILVQTVGQLRKAIDSRAYRETERLHLEAFAKLCGEIRREFPDALCLGTGGCRICKVCAWPEPCRFPDRAVSSMEGYGLFVTQVCRDCGADYHHGEKTITYTACVLVERKGEPCPRS